MLPQVRKGDSCKIQCNTEAAPMTISSQMEGDALLAEHRAVMSALLRESIRRPTEEQYAETLELVRVEFASCVTDTKLLSA